MKIFDEWQDFILYPTSPTKVEFMEQRLDISGGIQLTMADTRLPYEQYEAKRARMKEVGQIMVLEDTIPPEEQFESMGIDEVGDVWIWTTNLVCFLQRVMGTERMIHVPRNPFIREKSQAS